MTPDQFVQQCELLMKARFGAHGERLVAREVYAGMGAFVTIEVRGLLVRLTTEHGLDYVVDVASCAEPNEWHHLPEVLLLLSGRPYRSEEVRVGKSFEELIQLCDRLEADLEQVVVLFRDDRLSDTRNRLAGIRQQVVQPLVDLAESNRR